jgi:hypothetical protein
MVGIIGERIAMARIPPIGWSLGGQVGNLEPTPAKSFVRAKKVS